MVLHFGEEHVPGFVEANFVRLIEGGCQGRTAVAGVALRSGSGDSRELMLLQVEAAHAVIADFTEVKRAVGSDDEAVGIVGLSGDGWAAVARKARDAGSCNGGDSLRSRAQNEGD